MPASPCRRVDYVGWWGDHGVAKKAGVQKGDVVISWNGSDAPMTTSEILARTVNATKIGDVIPMSVLRNGRKMDFKLRMQ